MHQPDVALATGASLLRENGPRMFENARGAQYKEGLARATGGPLDKSPAPISAVIPLTAPPPNSIVDTSSFDVPNHKLPDNLTNQQVTKEVVYEILRKEAVKLISVEDDAVIRRASDAEQNVAQVEEVVKLGQASTDAGSRTPSILGRFISGPFFDVYLIHYHLTSP